MFERLHTLLQRWCCPDYKFCGEPSFKSKRGGSVAHKDVLHKGMHYLSLIPILKTLYAQMSLAPYMRWHFKNRMSDGIMTHPSYDEAWQHLDWTYPDFASDSHNIRLGFYADGITPNNQFSKPYSC